MRMHQMMIAALESSIQDLRANWQRERRQRKQALKAFFWQFPAQRRHVIDALRSIELRLLRASNGSPTRRCVSLLCPRWVPRLAEILTSSHAAHSALAILVFTEGALGDDRALVQAADLLAHLGRREAATHWLARGAVDFPGSTLILERLSKWYAEAGRYEAALSAYSRCLQIDPYLAAVHLQVGLLHIRQQRWSEARKALENAVADAVVGARAHLVLAVVHRSQGDLKAAIRNCEAALADPRSALRANILLATLHDEAGHPAEARRASYQALTLMPADRFSPHRDGRSRVAILCGLGSGSIRLDRRGSPFIGGGHNNLWALIDESKYSPYLVWSGISSRGRKWSDDLAAADIVVNVMAEPDSQAADLAAAARALEEAATPVINAPVRILAATRDMVSANGARINGLIVPRTVRCGSPLGTNTRLDVRYPVICRPLGSHAGDGLTFCRDPSSFPVPDLVGHQGFYVTEFHDLKGNDGFYRKARVYWIEGRAYPEHYYVSDHWNVHGKRSRQIMAVEPRFRHEATAFLNGFDPTGPLAHVLAKIVSPLGLDVVMTDIGFTRDGTPVLFEVNAAASLIQPHDFAAEGTHVIPFTRAIQNAFGVLLEARLDKGRRRSSML